MVNQPKMGKGFNGPSNAAAGGGSPNLDSGSLGPVMDMLGRMESQVGSIAQNRPGETSAASAADEELNNLREELLAADRRGYEELASFTHALEELKHAIPSLIDDTVNRRFLEVEDSFHRNIKEIHARSTEAFTQSVNSKIGQRLAALETNLSIHTEAMGQLREHYLKTDRNVQRLMTGLDRLTAELMRLSGGTASAPSRTIYAPGNVRQERYDFRPLSQPAQPQEEALISAAETSGTTQRVRKKKARRRSAPMIAAYSLLALIVLLPIGFLGWSFRSGLVTTAKESATPNSPLTGIPAQMKMAADFVTDKNYAKAESTYRLILKTDPNNREAIKELASVLFRQQRYDEAAAVLKTLPPE
jgi:tetratricopeptide (TPR) repeat protein